MIFDLCLGKTHTVNPNDNLDDIVFEKFRYQNGFRPHENKKPAFSNSSGLKNVFIKLRFLCRIIVDGRPNRGNKAVFLNYSGVVCMGPHFSQG